MDGGHGEQGGRRQIRPEARASPQLLMHRHRAVAGPRVGSQCHGDAAAEPILDRRRRPAEPADRPRANDDRRTTRGDAGGVPAFENLAMHQQGARRQDSKLLKITDRTDAWRTPLDWQSAKANEQIAQRSPTCLQELLLLRQLGSVNRERSTVKRGDTKQVRRGGVRCMRREARWTSRGPCLRAHSHQRPRSAFVEMEAGQLLVATPRDIQAVHHRGTGTRAVDLANSRAPALQQLEQRRFGSLTDSPRRHRGSGLHHLADPAHKAAGRRLTHGGQLQVRMGVDQARQHSHIVDARTAARSPQGCDAAALVPGDFAGGQPGVLDKDVARGKRRHGQRKGAAPRRDGRA